MARTSAASKSKVRKAAKTAGARKRAARGREMPLARSAKRAPAKARKASVAKALTTYRKKRSFDITPEPRGDKRPTAANGARHFVVQKHAASHLHYDFRLELDGVLLSWSVPKGPSLRAGERRLAVRTEDHPLDYASFEGTIPKGQYGGGSVIVWDEGDWIALEEPREGLKRGRLSFELKGKKLSGRFHLVRTRLDRSKRENWLLFKGRDAAATDRDVVADQPESVLSGKTVEEVGEESAPIAESEPEPVPDMVSLVQRLEPGFALTNLDKVLFPEQGLRKAEIIAYYVSVASVMLPYVARRPLVLVRCPHGRKQKCFYQKHIDRGVPEAVDRVPIQERDKRVQYAAVHDLNGLIALAQLGVLEIHLWGCHVDQVEKPDLMVLDIDPGEGVAWDQVVESALSLRKLLTALGLESFVKTTGGKGLHVVVPLKRGLSWDQHKALSHAIVTKLAAAQPDRYLTNMRKDLRKGRLFLDYLRNGRGATAIAPYSTRAREGATVATPLRWDELERGVDARSFDVRSVLRRLEAQKLDPWHGFLDLQRTQALSAAVVKRLTG